MARTSTAVFLSLFVFAGCGGRLELPADVSDGGVSDTGTDSAVLCEDSAMCGPAIRMPAVTCWDGSIGGNTGRCVKQADGTCGWEIRECPPETCTGVPGECGGDYYCARPTGSCGGTGKCVAKPGACPGDWSPVCGCDGKTYSNTCIAAAAGVSVAMEGACATIGKECSPSYGMHCATGEFCKFPEGMCWASDTKGGNPGAPPSPTPPIPTGTCEKIPAGCPDVWVPVCGCDGETYSNECDADVAGVGVQHAGECAPGKACGGFGGFTCAWNEYCDWADAHACGSTDATGVCKPRPTVCDDDYAPICGCDGVTYPNACTAYGAGVDVFYTGTCH